MLILICNDKNNNNINDNNNDNNSNSYSGEQCQEGVHLCPFLAEIGWVDTRLDLWVF